MDFFGTSVFFKKSQNYLHSFDISHNIIQNCLNDWIFYNSLLRSAGSELSVRWKIPSSFQHHIYYCLTCIDFFYNIITRMGQFMPLSHWSTRGSIKKNSPMLSHGLVEKHFLHALLQRIVPWFIYAALFDFN